MAYAPQFMVDRSEYVADKERVSTLDDYVKFRLKWFSDERSWPKRTPEQIKQAGRGRRGSFRLGGRTWRNKIWTNDLSAEARYESFSVAWEMESPLRHGEGWDPPHRPEGTWSRACPACEMSTGDLDGGDACPECGRKFDLVSGI